MPKHLLLGPQRPVLNLGDAIRRAGFPAGPFAVISAGWQEAEGDIDDVRQVVGRDVVDLRLYHRAEEIFHSDPELRAAYRTRQDKLVELQRLHRLRLRQLMLAARLSLRAESEESLVLAERRHAVSQLRALDRHHLKRIERLHTAFDNRFHPLRYEPLAAHAHDIARTLEGCETVLITGGNVAVLMNRLRMFGVGTMLGNKHVVAWSAGAMVLAERIVLYHDRTPLERRDAELLGTGTGLLPGFVFLPDGSRRLRTKNDVRMSLFSRRFSTDRCVLLDSGAELLLEDRRPVMAEAARTLGRDGRVTRLRAG